MVSRGSLSEKFESQAELDSLIQHNKLQLLKEPKRGILKSSKMESSEERERWQSGLKLLTLLGINLDKPQQFIHQTSKLLMMQELKVRELTKKSWPRTETSDAVKDRVQQSLAIIYYLVDSLMKGKKFSIPSVNSIPWEPCNLLGVTQETQEVLERPADLDTMHPGKKAGNSNYKTLPCKWFHSVGCQRGKDCDYIHDMNYKGVMPPPHAYHQKKHNEVSAKKGKVIGRESPNKKDKAKAEEEKAEASNEDGQSQSKNTEEKVDKQPDDENKPEEEGKWSRSRGGYDRDYYKGHYRRDYQDFNGYYGEDYDGVEYDGPRGYHQYYGSNSYGYGGRRYNRNMYDNDWQRPHWRNQQYRYQDYNKDYYQEEQEPTEPAEETKPEEPKPDEQVVGEDGNLGKRVELPPLEGSPSQTANGQSPSQTEMTETKAEPRTEQRKRGEGRRENERFNNGRYGPFGGRQRFNRVPQGMYPGFPANNEMGMMYDPFTNSMMQFVSSMQQNMSAQSGDPEKKRGDEPDKPNGGEDAAPRTAKTGEEEPHVQQDDEDEPGEGEEEVREEDRADEDEGPEDAFEETFGFLGYGRSKAREGRDHESRAADYHQQQRMHSFNQQLFETMKKYPFPADFYKLLPQMLGLASNQHPQTPSQQVAPLASTGGQTNLQSHPFQGMLMNYMMQMFSQPLNLPASGGPPPNPIVFPNLDVPLIKPESEAVIGTGAFSSEVPEPREDLAADLLVRGDNAKMDQEEIKDPSSEGLSLPVELAESGAPTNERKTVAATRRKGKKLHPSIPREAPTLTEAPPQDQENREASF